MKRNYNQLLEHYYNEQKEDHKQILKQKLYKKYGTNKRCFRCGSQLLVSDLKQYKYLCLCCDENFYEFEVLEGRNNKNAKIK